MIFKIFLGGDIMANSTEFTIKVCQGPGCKAWGAEGLLKELVNRTGIKSSKNGKKVCGAPCMNRCGGGTSVLVGDDQSFMKIRESSLSSMLCTLPASA